MNQDVPEIEPKSTQEDEEKLSLTREEMEALLATPGLPPDDLRLYQGGFMVAVNFIFHHAAAFENQAAIDHLNECIAGEVFQRAVEMRFGEGSGDPSNCPPGTCPPGCERCKFQFAFNGRYFTGTR
ncbi:MAG TPA: hypothetical protein VK892_22930 [Pyrinomonadaceae bacterium]|nr:hypothetical protein [Pyrinomonadaceae bacterium]